MLFPDARAIFGVVQEQIGQLSALLNEVLHRQDRRLLFEHLSGDSHQLAQNEPGVVKAQRLIEIARQQIPLHKLGFALHISPPVNPNEYR